MPVLGMAQELKVLKVGQITVAEVIRCLPLRGADLSKTDEGGFQLAGRPQTIPTAPEHPKSLNRPLPP